MAALSKIEMERALTRLGELAAAEGAELDLLLVGGGVMVLEFETRPATRDVDVVVLAPPDPAAVRRLARTVAAERDWPDDWLNDAVKGFVVGSSPTTTLLSGPGITVRRPAVEQLLAMKLCAWRDDVDIADARRLLAELRGGVTLEQAWRGVEPHLQPGRELKARYALEDLWEDSHGHA